MKSIFEAKVIKILVNYTTKWKNILDDIRILITSLDLVAIPQPTLLNKVSNFLLDMETLMFLDLLKVKALQTLSTPTKLASKNLKTFRLDKMVNMTLDACHDGNS